VSLIDPTIARMRRQPGRWAPLWAALVTFAAITAVVGASLHARADRHDSGHGDGSGASVPDKLSAQVVQLRRDEALGRVEVGVTNEGSDQVAVTRLRLRIDGFTGGGWVAKDSPIPAGQVVNLPVPYGAARCPAAGAPVVGRIRVDMRLAATYEAPARVVHLAATASRPLVTRILTALCTAERLRAEVALSFGPTWRSEGHGDGLRLHTTIEARLAPSAGALDLSQLRGNVLYNLNPLASTQPLASLDAAHPTASLPVVLSLARCSGHAKGEIKKPYLFLVWLGPPGTDGQAVELPVNTADKTRLRAICAF
jgi:hypothetical protein